MSLSPSKGCRKVALDTLAAIIIGAQKRGTSLKSKPWLACLVGARLLLGLMGVALWLASPVAPPARRMGSKEPARGDPIPAAAERPCVLEWLALPTLNALQLQWERPIPGNFAKGPGNRVSYGLLMKDASEWDRIERNLARHRPDQRISMRHTPAQALAQSAICTKETLWCAMAPHLK